MHHFFQAYDCYDGRIFEHWEICMIFKDKVKPDVFLHLTEDNQDKKEQLSSGQLSFKYLCNEIEMSNFF